MKKIFILLLVCATAMPVMAQWRTKKVKSNEPDTTFVKTRMGQLMKMVAKDYVDKPNMDNAEEKAMMALLRELDPHSVYIPARDVERANESLQGNFEGVGVQFQIVDDTIVVAEVIVGGPSEKVGLMRGDKFLTINGVPATGDSITNAWVPKHLRGKKGTKVELEMLRGGEKINFTVVRDKVPIYSVDCSFMADDTIGYIRLTRFARTSSNEVRNAIGKLKGQGMKSLILDLRGNGGGYLDVACALANEFLPSRSLIVYQEGRSVKRQNFYSNHFGSFRQGRLVVLIDENSASASEIVSGAIQDQDRGVIVGRRSFGKGLVQHLYTMSDGAQVRLTTARYYTPSGRCIQKPYDKGADAYRNDMNDRFKNGELVSADSVKFVDSLKYTTRLGRTVYGGGGIMPDVFVPMDTMRLSQFCISVRSKGLVNDWAIHWADKLRDSISRNNVSLEAFDTLYTNESLLRQLEAYCMEKGVVRDVEAEAKEPERTAKSDDYMALLAKAIVARDLFGNDAYYQVMRKIDDGYKVAVETLRKKQ